MKKIFEKFRTKKKSDGNTFQLLCLPVELLDHISSFLHLQDLRNLSLTNKFMLKVTEKSFSDKCVVNPNKPRTFENFQRTYFNIKLERMPVTPLPPAIVPKNLYLTSVNHFMKKYVNENLKVENVFVHLSVTNLEDPEKIKKDQFVRDIVREIVGLKVEFLQNVDRLYSWIFAFSSVTILEIVITGPIEEFKKLTKPQVELPNLKKLVFHGIGFQRSDDWISNTFTAMEEMLKVMRIASNCALEIHLKCCEINERSLDIFLNHKFSRIYIFVEFLSVFESFRRVEKLLKKVKDIKVKKKSDTIEVIQRKTRILFSERSLSEDKDMWSKWCNV